MKSDKKKINIDKKKIIIGLLILWFVLATTYILWDILNKRINSFIMYGYSLAVEDLIDSAEKDCNPFVIYSEDREIELINFDCIEVASQEEFQEMPTESIE